MDNYPSDDSEEEFIDRLDPLIEYSDVLYDKKSVIHDIFEKEFSNSDNNDIKTDFSEFFSRVDVALAADIETEDRREVAEALINAVAQLGVEEDEQLREEYNQENLAEMLRSLKWEYLGSLRRRVSRQFQGLNWWSNIGTDPKFRNDNPGFTHEIVIDDRKVIEIDNNLNSSIILANHFVNQVKDAEKTHGEDAFSDIQLHLVEDLLESVEETVDNIEQYKDQEDSDNSQSEDAEKDHTGQ